MIFIVICLFIVIFVTYLLVAVIKDKIKEDKVKKEQEEADKITAEKKEQEEKARKEFEAKQMEECEKNKDVDISKLPFCVEFEKEFNMSFQDFKNSFRKIELSKSPKSTVHQGMFLMYNDKYFYITGGLYLLGYGKKKKPELSIDRYEFAEIFLESNKTDYALKIYEKTKVSDFKYFLYSIDDLLYIKEYNESTEYTFNDTPNKPSSLSLAVTESLYGTAAAMNKINNNEQRTSKIEYYGLKFYFSENTNLPVLYYVKLGDSKYLSPDVNYLFNLKSYERYQERMLKNSAKESNTNSSLDEIKKLKELLDCGAITQEEFDSKKKELLNLK